MRRSETQDEAFVFNPNAEVYVPQNTKQEQLAQPQQSHRVCPSIKKISAADGSNERSPLEAHLQITPPVPQIIAPRMAASENKEVEAESNKEQAESSQRLAPQTAAKKETKDKKEEKTIIEEEETQYCSDNDGEEEEREQGGNKYKQNAGPVLFKKWSKSWIGKRWRPNQKKTTQRLWKNCSAAPSYKGAKQAKEHTVKSTINKWFETVGEDDCQEDEPLQVISESLDLVYFHELRVPIHVNTVPKYKLVFTKDLKKRHLQQQTRFSRGL